MSASMEAPRARALVQGFAGCRVLVIGDLMLDRYVWGKAERISPEAPVPVVRVDRESTMLGGAGNVVRNLVSLGAQVHVAAVVGADAAARELGRRLDYWKIDPDGLIVEASRPTTEKTRVIALGQQVVRYDKECDDEISPESQAQLLDAVRSRAKQADGAVIQDYGKGLLTREVVREVMDLLDRFGVRVFVDPKPLPWDLFGRAELVKPNLREAQELARVRARSADDLERVGRAVLEHCGAQVVAITRGEDGMTLFPRDDESLNVPTLKRAVADQAGAGDTAVATLALGRLSGAAWLEAAQLANAAAGVVVGVRGTATLTPADLLRALGAGV